MSLDDRAKNYFNSGYNCAESVLLALAQEPFFKGGDFASALPRVATGFGGGLARNGLICGALSGGIMALGLMLGRNQAKESRDPCYPAVDRLVKDFQERFGSIHCRDISRVDLKTEEGRRRYQQMVHLEICNPVVAWSALRAREIIAQYAGGIRALA